MKKILILALFAAAVQGQEPKLPSNPVADAARSWLQLEAKNLIAAAQEMPADKYSFHPTPQQMTFAHLMVHIADSNRYMCAGIAGESVPKEIGVTDKDDKDKLVASVEASFNYCSSALAKVDDSKLDEQVQMFGRTRANLMMYFAAELADHYGTAAIYLRLNGLLPPTAQPKK